MAMIGYVRVSDDRQNEALQVDALLAAGCEQIYSDHGVSGKQTKRKGLNAVLAELKEGDTFIVWKFDRLGRSTIHLLLLFDDFRKRGINFVSTTQGINTATVEGRIFFGQLALFAEYEREMISQRTKAGMAAARKRGVKLGRPPALSQGQVRRIKTDYKRKRISHAKLADRFGVCERTISRVINCGAK